MILRSFKPQEPFVVRFDYPLFVVETALDPEDLKAPPGKKPGTYEQKYSAEELVAPFRKDGAPAVLSLSDWHGQLIKAGKPIARSTLWRRLKEDPGFPVEQYGRGKYRLKQPRQPGKVL